MQQAPGPRDRAQVLPLAPQLAAAGGLERTAPTEKTEICWARLCPWHRGHSGLREPITSTSKGFLQSLQMYSKMGMVSNCDLRRLGNAIVRNRVSHSL
jgi:hypothetical protein